MITVRAVKVSVHDKLCNNVHRCLTNRHTHTDIET